MFSRDLLHCRFVVYVLDVIEELQNMIQLIFIFSVFYRRTGKKLWKYNACARSRNRLKKQQPNIKKCTKIRKQKNTSKCSDKKAS